MTANCITISRILFSLSLFAFAPSSYPFAVLYLLCGVTDVLDGYTARKLHTESRTGELLDSAADLVFAAVYATVILPRLALPLWIWAWTAMIAAVKVTVIMTASIKAKRLRIRHSFWNKLTGLLLFLLPLSVHVADIKYGAGVVCISATAAMIGEILIQDENGSSNE